LTNMDAQQQAHILRLGVIGVPTNSSGTNDGVARAPQALRHAGLLDILRQRYDVKDYGDVPFLTSTPERSQVSGIIAEVSLLSMIQAVQQTVGRVFSEGRFPLVIGGDCPLLLGCLAAARRVYDRVGLLFVDGHEDAYAPHQSPTGEAADMELGLALGFVPTTGLATELKKLLPLVHPYEVGILGARDATTLQTEEIPSIRQEVELYNDQALQTGSLEETTRMVLTHIRGHAHRWWLHVDLDVLSTEALSAVDYLQPGGLNWPQLETLTATAMTTEGLIGWDMTIYNPDLDRDGSRAVRIVEYLLAATAHLSASLR
jgi:arginase